jgi:CDP-glucose 4,6-dehydratase
MTGRIESWQDTPVLVTGAHGLLGGAMVAELLDRGARVVIIERDLDPDSRLMRSGLAERCVRVRGDVCAFRDVERALQDYDCRALFHLAAQAIVGTAKRSPFETFESNVRGTWVVLEAARQAPLLDAIVVASSDKAYGASEDLPYTEAHPLGGRGPYDASKAMGDLAAQSFAASYSMPLCIVRCGNLYGPGDVHFNRLIPEMIRARLRGDVPVLRSDGSAQRDYLFVGDAVEAYLGLAERAGELAGEAFNISTGRPWTVLEVCAAVDSAVGIDTPAHRILGVATAQGEIPHQTLDSSKIARVTGWTAQTELTDGLEATVGWYRGLLG